MKKPKVLLFDIETKPILAWVWGLWKQDIPLNMIKEDWAVISWAAKWLGDPPSKIMYKDQRKTRDLMNDKNLLKGIWKLLDEADVVITQNGKRFDSKKLNARFIKNGMTPPSPYRHIDTKQLATKYFGFTSNKLEYMTEFLGQKTKKSKHKKFPGFALWKAVMNGNQDAWKEMEEYNKIDVLSLEELYNRFAPWGKGVNFDVYQETTELSCDCGDSKLRKRGFEFTKTGKFQKYQCKSCGAWCSSKNNLLSKEKKKSLKR